MPACFPHDTISLFWTFSSWFLPLCPFYACQLAFFTIHCLYFGLFLLDFFHYVHFMHASLLSSRYDLFILDFFFLISSIMSILCMPACFLHDTLSLFWTFSSWFLPLCPFYACQLAFLTIHCPYFGLFLLDVSHYVHFQRDSLPSTWYYHFILDFFFLISSIMSILCMPACFLHDTISLFWTFTFVGFRNIFNTTVYFISKIY